MGAGATAAVDAGPGTGRSSRVGAIGFGMSILGWVVLVASLFLERATSPLPGISVNPLIETWPYGISLVFLLALILPAILFARRLPTRFTWLLAGLWLLASAVTIYAGLNLDSASTTAVGTPAYVGYGTAFSSNDTGIGTTLSIIGANLGFVGTGLMAFSRRDA